MAAQDDPFDGNSPPAETYYEFVGQNDLIDEYGFPISGSPAQVDSNNPNSDEAYQRRETERERAREELYGRLNERQAEAVNAPKESMLVLAGAGSGKTSVLTARIANLVSNGVAPSRSILAVTFTNKAAQEMRQRLGKLLDKRSVQDLWMGTFHSLCNKLLRENYEAAGLPKAFAILDVDSQEALCRGILKDFGLTKSAVKEAAKARAANAQADLLAVADPLAAAGGLAADDIEDDGEANEFVTPGQCAKYISARKEALEEPKPPTAVNTRSTDVDQMEAVYAEYQRRCRQSGLLDFQDLLTRGVELLEKSKDVRDKYQNRFTAILVDEFQDTNNLQYRWLELMKGPRAHMMTVGDDSQCVAEGTAILMADGSSQPVESIAEGALVLANHGAGNFKPSKVTRAIRRRARTGEGAIRIRTSSGHELLTTADHTHLAGFLPAYCGALFVCYVMQKEGVGFRVGVTRMGQHSATARNFSHGLSYRCSQEGADRAWVIGSFQSEQEAREHEVLTSLKYGLPTLPFLARSNKRDTMATLVGDQGALDRIFAKSDSTSGAARLMADIGMSLDHPQHVPQQSRFSRRKNITVTLCAWHRPSGRALHTLAFGFSGEPLKVALENAGFQVRLAKVNSASYRVEVGASNYEKIETTLASLLRVVPDAYVKRSMRLLSTDANGVITKSSLDLMPAFNLVPGMSLCDAEGKVQIIESVERLSATGFFYDLDVAEVHNFVANGIVTHNCIYGFRGANPENMTRFVKEMTVSKEHPDGWTIKLEQNYRSLPHILEAANAIIDRNPNQLKKTLFTSQRDRGEKIDLVSFGNGMFEASAVADSIHRMVKDHKVLPSEIAVLYRTNMQSRLLEQEMNKRGLPVTVYGGYRFYDRQEIKNVLAYLDLICDMTRDLSFARVVNFPPRGIGERTVEQLRQDAQAKRISMMEMIGERSERVGSIGTAAEQKKQRQLEGFTNIIIDLAESAVDQPLSQLIETIMQRAGIEKHFIDEAGGSKSSQEEADERMANIGELISAAKQFEIDNPELKSAAEQLPEYLAYVALMTSTSEADMEKKSTVSLMTVHSSKGLEFDHVYLVGLEEATFPHSRAIKEDEESGNGKSIDDALRDMGATHDDDGNSLVFDEDEEEAPREDGEGMQEERRLMYVAVTRARKTLTATYAKERLLNGEVKACEPSRFISEIPGHRLNFIDDAKSRAGAGKKPYLRDVGNREYGGDAFDQGRKEYQPDSKSAKSAAKAPLRTQSSFAESDLSTDSALDGVGRIRVVSKRRGGTAAADDEVVIDVDRSHPELGNRHFLNNIEDDDERADVIAAYNKDYQADLAKSGPMFQATMDVAKRVARGEKIALRCWCAPRACHADLIAAQVIDYVRAMGSEKAASSAVAPAAALPAAVQAPAPAVAGELKPWQRRGANALRAAAQPPAVQRPALSVVPSAVSDGPGRVLAIIGTAGRDKDRPMTADLWGRMVADAKKRVRADDTVVSGGAAWADHLAVRLFLDGDVKDLVLHLPAPLKNGKFQGPDKSAASAANWYHDLFQKATGVDARAEIAAAASKGATITEQPEAHDYKAMFARNAIVAKQSNAVLAYTFGGGDEPADGGTKNTWDQIKGDRIHVPLLALGPLTSSPLPARQQAQPAGAAPARQAPPAAAMARLDLLGKRRGSRP
ncbi:UvrD-helicase domain-containing protein [Paucibacter soli]|uniref:UvrD-helicase domain-containing protein n=1 Tax=Paucibacter soli TaxID=3133433 RepID=UPI0030AB5D0F